MKQLFINNKRVILNDNIMFPFTEKINDLENITIIGLPSTKSVQIPRCPENDEIFGHLAEITRVVVSDVDNKVGISFNQIKRTEYKLIVDSEIISEGIIRLVNITDKSYEIELYDKLIDILEQLEGNPEENTGYLNSLKILQADGITEFEMESTAYNVKQLNDNNNSVIKPVVNLKEFESTGTDCRLTYVPTTGTPYITNHTLPTELTPIQFRTLKNYEVEYSIPVSSVIKSINDTYNIITYDESLTHLFDEIQLRLKSPTNQNSMDEDVADGEVLSTKTVTSIYNLNNTLDIFNVQGGPNKLMLKNGQYYLEIPFSFILTPNAPISYLSFYKTSNGTYYNTGVNSADGVFLGDLRVKISFKGYDSDDWLFFGTQEIIQTIKLYKNVNTFLTVNGSNQITQLEIAGSFIINLEYYPKFEPYFFNKTKIKFDFSQLLYRSPGDLCYLFTNFVSGALTAPLNYTIVPTISDYKVNREQTEFRTGDLLNGSTLYPKVPIKEFIINLVKYFNLNISNKDGKLHIDKKRYYKTTEIPILQEITNLQVLNFDFSKLSLSTKLPQSEPYDKYNKINKMKYGEQIINTNYSIKKNTKKIEFEIGIPGIVRDANAFAYDRFGGYFNGGYSRVSLGDSTEYDNDIVFGYLNEINDSIFIANDTPYEGNLITASGTPTEVKFVLNNEYLKYYQATGLYEFPLTDSAGQNRKLSKYYTLSPLKIGNNGVVISSLELDKPKYNYANITDSQYPDTSTHYYRYFKKQISDIYNTNTHILSVKMFINGVIDKGKIYNYKNSNYIISEITEYDPTEPGIYEVKLLRVNNIDNYIIPIYLYDFTFNVQMTFDGDITEYASDFLRFESDLYKSYSTPDNYQFVTSLATNIYMFYDNFVDKTYLVNGYSFLDTNEETTTYKYKLLNNKLIYKQNGVDGALFFDDSVAIEILPNYWGAEDYAVQQTLNTNIFLTDGVVKINEVTVSNPIKSLLTYDSGSGYSTISLSMDLQVTDGINFNSASKYKFGKIQIDFYGETAYFDNSNAESIIYTDLDGGTKIRYNFDISFYTANPDLTLDDVTVYLLGNDGFLNDSGYVFVISYDGTFTSGETIQVTDDTGYIEFESITTNPTKIYTEFTGDNSGNVSVYALDYSLYYEYNKQLQ